MSLKRCILMLLGGVLAMAMSPVQAQEQYQITPGIVSSVDEGITGAIARDAFNGNALNMNLWYFWNSTPGINVEVKDGYCRIFGTPAADLSKDKQGFNGLVSPRFWETDATIAVEMMAPSAALGGQGGYYCHFCGSIPDRYPEIVLMGEPGKLRWQFDAVQEGGGWYSDPNSVPVTNDPTTQWTELQVQHDGPTEMSRVLFRSDGGWTQVGKEYISITNVSRTELKLMCPAEDFGKMHDLRFRNFRMYANPRHNPVKLMVIDSKLWSARNMDVTLWTEDHSKVAAKGTTDQFGRVYLDLSNAPWEVYPVGCIVELSRGGQVLGQGSISSGAVNGLYPRTTYLVTVTSDESAR